MRYKTQKEMYMFQVSRFKIQDQRGQLLVEAILGIALLAILAGIISSTVQVSNQSNKTSGKRTVAIGLAQEAVEALGAIKNYNDTDKRGWNRIYGANKTSANHYYPQDINNTWQLTSGDEPVTIDGSDYTRYLYIEYVCRDSKNGGGDIVSTGTCNETTSFNDPSTQYIKIVVQASAMQDIVLEEYLSRSKNETSVWDSQAEFTASGATCSNTKVVTGSVELQNGSNCN